MVNLQCKTEYVDEISLFDLMKIFWQQKWVILTITIFCFGISVLYLQLAKPVYEAKVRVTLPSVNSIAMLNLSQSYSAGSQQYLFDINQMYQLFSDTLESNSIKNDFFKQVYLPYLTDMRRESIPESKLFNNYLKKISIKKDPKTLGITVIAETDNPYKSREFVKKFIALAEKKALLEMQEKINDLNRIKALDIQQKIAWTRELAKKYRIDRLSQLNDAMVTAKAVGLQNFSMNGTLNNINKSSILFMLGTKALESEIKILNAKEIDYGLVPQLRELENAYNFYSNAKVSVEAIKMFQFEDVINLPSSPIWPKKNLILILGLIGGLMLGFFTALVLSIFLKRN